MVDVEIVVLLKVKLQLLSDFGIYTYLDNIFTPIPSRYFALKAYGTYVIRFLGERVSAPTRTSKYTEPLF